MPRILRHLIDKALRRIFPRFAVWRALQMVRLYAETGLSRKRLDMLEDDAQELLKRGKLLDALRILHCALLLNPKAGNLRAFAKELVAKRWKLKESNAISKSQVDVMIEAKMDIFADYVMQCVDRGGFSKACVPKSN